MDLTRREYSMHGHNTLLKDFIQQNENKLKKLQDDAKIAQVLLTQHTRPTTTLIFKCNNKIMLIKNQVFKGKSTELMCDFFRL